MHIDPKSGSTAGNEDVTIGKGYWDQETIEGTTVMFDEFEVMAEGADQDDKGFYTSIKAKSPPHPAAKVWVKVLTPADEDGQIAEEQFEYKFKIDSVKPARGKTQDAANNDIIVSIKGDDLVDVETVQFDDKPARFGVISTSHIWAIVPDPGKVKVPEKDLVVKVTVKTAHGEDKDHKFTYI
jgi:hypothetical protein